MGEVGLIGGLCAIAPRGTSLAPPGGVFALALVLSLFIGLSLGLLGGGGSILTTPILVYALGVEPKAAIATSLVVVGITSLSGVVQHARLRNVEWRTGFTFGAAGMVGAFAGGKLAGFLEARTLMVAFAGMMLVTAAAMFRGRKEPSADAPAPSLLRVVLYGLGVGSITGLVGAGGGFVVVPALALLGRLSMHRAIGTSLLVITLNTAAGFLGHLGHVEVDWRLAALVSTSAVVGSLVGSRLAPRVPAAALRRGFAVFVLFMGAFVLYRQL